VGELAAFVFKLEKNAKEVKIHIPRGNQPIKTRSSTDLY